MNDWTIIYLSETLVLHRLFSHSTGDSGRLPLSLFVTLYQNKNKIQSQLPLTAETEPSILLEWECRWRMLHSRSLRNHSRNSGITQWTTRSPCNRELCWLSKTQSWNSSPHLRRSLLSSLCKLTSHMLLIYEDGNGARWDHRCPSGRW